MKYGIIILAILIYGCLYAYEHIGYQQEVNLFVIEKKMIPPQPVSAGFSDSYEVSPYLIHLKNSREEISLTRVVSREIWKDIKPATIITADLKRGRITNRILKIEPTKYDHDTTKNDSGKIRERPTN